MGCDCGNACNLGNLGPGCEAVVFRFNGGSQMRDRLAALGIYEGTVVEVMQRVCGQVIVQCGHGRVGLGRGLAEKIMVQPVKEVRA